jgi:hypothetical protein
MSATKAEPSQIKNFISCGIYFPGILARTWIKVAVTRDLAVEAVF